MAYSFFFSALVMIIVSQFMTVIAANRFGITISPGADGPSPSTTTATTPEELMRAASGLGFQHIRLVQSETATEFLKRVPALTNFKILLTIPTGSIDDVARDIPTAKNWILEHLMPYSSLNLIHLISVGDDVRNDAGNNVFQDMKNFQAALKLLGLARIKVSTTVSFNEMIENAFPPSKASFKASNIPFMAKVLPLLEETSTPLLWKLYPLEILRARPGVPLAFTFFKHYRHMVCLDIVDGGVVEYNNLFDMMLDSVKSAIGKLNHEIAIVAETGWPSGGVDLDADKEYAQLYLAGLVNHLSSSPVTPMGTRIEETKIYLSSLADGDDGLGLFWRNWTFKYDGLDFSGSKGIFRHIRTHYSRLSEEDKQDIWSQIWELLSYGVNNWRFELSFLLEFAEVAFSIFLALCLRALNRNMINNGAQQPPAL